eukprot:5511347-Pleurochrysis_carterae.AAC.2
MQIGAPNGSGRALFTNIPVQQARTNLACVRSERAPVEHRRFARHVLPVRAGRSHSKVYLTLDLTGSGTILAIAFKPAMSARDPRADCGGV